jgi:hypothetical protein
MIRSSFKCCARKIPCPLRASAARHFGNGFGKRPTALPRWQRMFMLCVMSPRESDEGGLIIDRRSFGIAADRVFELRVEGLIVPAGAFGAQGFEGGIGQIACDGLLGEASQRGPSGLRLWRLRGLRSAALRVWAMVEPPALPVLAPAPYRPAAASARSVPSSPLGVQASVHSRAAHSSPRSWRFRTEPAIVSLCAALFKQRWHGDREAALPCPAGVFARDFVEPAFAPPVMRKYARSMARTPPVIITPS